MPNVIPTRVFRFDSDQPRPHCSPAQIMSLFRGVSLAQFQDPDGTLTGFTDDLMSEIVPEATSDAVMAMRTPYDWCRMVHFEDGNGTDTLSLPFKNIAYVNALFVRILPSLPWYRFTHFRNVDGTEFDAAGFVEPAPNKPYQIGNNDQYPVITPPFYTGIEDADILVDTRGQCVIIPPRALLLAAGLPLSNYSFIPGKANVEIHFAFGYPPTSYISGAPLTFVDGALQDPNPDPPENALFTPDSVDWSSGMPKALTRSVARLAANNILRQNWRGISFGLSSLNVDGASESYGSSPYDLDKDDDAITKRLARFGVAMVI